MSKRSESEASESYRVALLDLTFNSKPLITGLTVKARESTDYAPAIVKVIEQHFINAPANMKLPSLYLIDSIVKNLGQPFVELFTERLAETFCTSYTALTDDKTRREFLRVYGLWNGIFPEVPLRDIEERLRLRKSKRSASQALAVKPSAAMAPPHHPHHLPQPTAVYNQYPQVPPPPPFHGGYPVHGYYPPAPPPPPPAYYHHQPQPLYRPRLSPGGIGMMAQLRTVLMAPMHAFPQNTIPDIIYRLGAGGELDPQLLRDLDSRCRLPDARPALDMLSYLLDPQPSTPPPIINVPHLPELVMAPGHLAHPSPQIEVKKQPDHQFLYGDRPKQCKVCGVRFCDDEPGRDAYATHLDAHFRRNMKLRDRTKKVLARDWLQPAEDWSSGKAPGVTEKQVPVFFDEMIKMAREASTTTSGEQESDEQSTPSMIKVGDSERDRRCPMCNEQLKIIFDNDQDEWMFVNVVACEGEIYHKSCAPTSESDQPSSKKSRSE